MYFIYKRAHDVYLHVTLVFRYKQEYLMFNDDIQGTAATVLAGLYGAMKVQGLGPEAIKDQVSWAHICQGAGRLDTYEYMKYLSRSRTAGSRSKKDKVSGPIYIKDQISWSIVIK